MGMCQGHRAQDVQHLNSHCHEEICNLSILLLSWTICKKPRDSSRDPISTYSEENPSAHQRGCTENTEHLPGEICSLFCAGSRRIYPEPAIFKHLIRSAGLAEFQNLFPVYLFEILCPVRMLAAIGSTAQCRKHSCGKAETAFPILLKDWKMSHLPWTSQFHSVCFPLPPRFVLKCLWHLQLLSPIHRSTRNLLGLD